VANAERVVAIELLSAARGIDFLRPLRTSPALETAHRIVRAEAPFESDDRVGAPDVEAVAARLRAGALTAGALLEA